MNNYENYNDDFYEENEQQGVRRFLTMTFRFGVALFIIGLPIAQVLFFGWLISIL